MQLDFNRKEFAGSLGDLGTLLPIAFGMVLLNGVDGTAVFTTIGAYYILSGMYFGITVPVQPMKVIGAYAISRSLTPAQISGAGLLMGIILCLLSVTGAMERVQKIVPKSAVRGVQLSTGVILITKGLGFITGKTETQYLPSSEKLASFSAYLDPSTLNLLLGILAIVVIFMLLENKVAPAALVVIAGGAIVGWLLGLGQNISEVSLGFHYPQILPFGMPTTDDFIFALLVLALPQLPMTVGNAVIAQSDLTKEYFGDELAKRSSPRALGLSMGMANIVVSFLGGMPLCHGAGGLAAHYRFGSRTAGSNLMIGGIFLIAGILIGQQAIDIFAVVPISILGALLCFAGGQLSMMILDMKERSDLFVVISMLCVAIVSNLAIGFGIGIVFAYLFKHTKLAV